MLSSVDYFNNSTTSINISLITLNCEHWPAIVPAHPPHPDGLYGLGVEGGEVLGVHQSQTVTVQVHVQILTLQRTHSIHNRQQTQNTQQTQNMLQRINLIINKSFYSVSWFTRSPFINLEKKLAKNNVYYKLMKFNSIEFRL